jgi:hypothetical protein
MVASTGHVFLHLRLHEHLRPDPVDAQFLHHSFAANRPFLSIDDRQTGLRKLVVKQPLELRPRIAHFIEALSDRF